MHPSEAQARVVLAELIAQGVQDIVLCPGSRSAPLAFAAHALDSAGQARLHVRIDERSAAFTALGIAKASGRPVAVVTTSGTAAANLLPAVLEAHHAGAPLIILTADRPPELRGVGANQATDQLGLFGAAPRLFHEVGIARRELGQVTYWRDIAVRAAAAASGVRSRNPGPAHLNVGFAEPLTPDDVDDWPEPLDGQDARIVLPSPARQPYELPPAPGTVVIAGDGAGDRARDLAETGGWPLLAEPSSGARTGPNAIAPYRLLLDAKHLGSRIRRVIVWGRPTLSRPVTQLLARRGVDIVVVGDRPDWPDASRRAALVVTSATTIRVDDDENDRWLADWQVAGGAATKALLDVASLEPGMTGVGAAAIVDRALASDSVLMVGSSNSIRDLDLVMQPAASKDAAGHRRVLANRGLAGIDGTVSTAVGAALGTPGHPAYALMGDLTFLHDSNGLLIGPSEPRPDLTIVVVNDGGGGIFHTLEPGAAAYADRFERIFGTPHAADLGAMCAAHGARHQRVVSTDALASALRGLPCGLSVLEVPVDRRRVRDLHARLATAVSDAIGVTGSGA